MPTAKQKKVAKALIKNATLDKPKGSGEILESIGYSKSTAKHIPRQIIESKGVKQELIASGFNEDNAKRVVGQVLDGKKTQDKDKLKAADLIFKVQGSYAPEKTVNLNANVEMKENKEAQKLAEEYEEKLRQKMLK